MSFFCCIFVFMGENKELIDRIQILEAKILNYCMELPKEQQESFMKYFGITRQREGKI